MDNYVTRKRSGPSNTLLTQTAATDYEKLCKPDVLGLPDKPSADQSDVNKEIQRTIDSKSDRLVGNRVMLRRRPPFLAKQDR